jgi:putative ABC transport system substrate-binding protein
VSLAARHGIPTIYFRSDFAKSGSLISCGPSLAPAMRTVGGYIGQLLKGARPGDLAVQQSTGFELVINLEAAKAPGLAISRSVLGSADEAIDEDR